MTGSAKPQFALPIHYLRAIAALMVVAVHCFAYDIVQIDNVRPWAWLRHGVALFFVISGFVMVTSTSGQPISPGQFMVRRIIRIVPLYWVVTLCWSLINPNWDLARMIGSLTFVPSRDPASGLARTPVMDLGWTLNFEMFFYTVFALALLLPQRLRLWVVGIALALFSQARGLAILPVELAFFADPQLLLFVGGMAIATFDLRLPGWCAVAGFAGLALLPQVTYSQTASVFVPALAIVLGARGLERHMGRWKLPTLLGDASYAIYLTHRFVLQGIGLVLASLALPMLPMVVLLIAGSAGFGIMVHRAVELPLTAWCRRLLDTRRSARLAQVPA
jgi:exopolysaccharide production protein ExoZ